MTGIARSKLRSALCSLAPPPSRIEERTADVRDLGRELGVRYVLEGSVKRSGDDEAFTSQAWLKSSP